jgi:hypothetical protein
MEKIHVNIKPMPATRTELWLRLRNGQVQAASHDSGIPERNLTLQTEKLTRKFTHLMPLPAAARQELHAGIGSLEQLPDVRELSRLTAASRLGER